MPMAPRALVSPWTPHLLWRRLSLSCISYLIPFWSPIAEPGLIWIDLKHSSQPLANGRIQGAFDRHRWSLHEVGKMGGAGKLALFSVGSVFWHCTHSSVLSMSNWSVSPVDLTMPTVACIENIFQVGCSCLQSLWLQAYCSAWFSTSVPLSFVPAINYSYWDNFPSSYHYPGLMRLTRLFRSSCFRT